MVVGLSGQSGGTTSRRPMVRSRQRPLGTRRSTDRARGYGLRNGGSIPSGCTRRSVAQRQSGCLTRSSAQVRVLPGRLRMNPKRSRGQVVSLALAGSSPAILPGPVAQRRLRLAVNQVSHTQVRVLPGPPPVYLRFRRWEWRIARTGGVMRTSCEAVAGAILRACFWLAVWFSGRVVVPGERLAVMPFGRFASRSCRLERVDGRPPLPLNPGNTVAPTMGQEQHLCANDGRR